MRIYPIYWIYLTACIAGMVIVRGAHFQLASAMDWLATYGLVWLTSIELPLARAWTLFREAVFYAGFAALLVNLRVGLAVLSIWAMAVVHSFEYAATVQQTFQSTILGPYNQNFLVDMLALLATHRMSKAEALVGLCVGLGLSVCVRFACRCGWASPVTRPTPYTCCTNMWSTTR